MEICGIPVGIALLILVSILHKIYKDNSETERKYHTQVRWSGDLSTTLTIAEMQEYARGCFCEILRCSEDHCTELIQVFSRGDRSISRLPQEREVPWFEFPLKISLAFSSDDQMTQVSVRYFSHKDTEFDEDCRDFFYSQAETEFSYFSETLREWEQEEQERVEGIKAQLKDLLTEQYTSDCEALGLDVHASWEQIQAAYRAMCLKFHPDRLSGHDIPEEIGQLAVEKFKQATDAYQRLRKLRQHISSQEEDS